jgi:putative ABC transport system permease protein
MTTVAHDLRYAVRTLLRAPGFTSIVLVTLALGIGANTALFSVARTVLLDPLPFQDPDQLVLLSTTRPARGEHALPFSLPDFREVETRNHSFTGMAAWALRPFNLTADESEQVLCAVVTSGFFDLLGVRPAIGRVFAAADDRRGSPPSVVISHALWQRRFGGDRGIVGRGITLDGQSYQVVGVMPRGFRFLSFRNDTEIWLSLGSDWFTDRMYARAVRSMGVMARLRPGSHLAQAQADMNALARQLESETSDNRGRGIEVVRLRDQVVRNLRPAVFVLLGAVACVLLIACTNVASLLLARGAARHRELAIRGALGGSRTRLVRQLLTEYMILAGAGGALGLLVATWSIDLLRALPPATPSLFVPYSIEPGQITVDRTALLFTALLSMITAIIFGLVPAISGSRAELVQAMKQGGTQAAGQRETRFRASFVVIEVALAVILLVGSALLIRTFVSLRDIDPGFQPDNVLTFNVTLRGPRYRAPARSVEFFDELLTRLRATPGVAAAGGAEFLPLSGIDGSTPLHVEGQPPPAPGEEVQAHYRAVTSGYFQAIGIRLVEGRGLLDSDTPGAARVAVANETLARRLSPDGSAVGRRVALTLEALRFRPDGPPTRDLPSAMREIVGIAADVRHSALRADPVPELFVPLTQRPVSDLAIVVRTTGDPSILARDVRRIVAAIDPAQPVTAMTSVSDLVATSIAQPRFNVLLLSSFAALAMVLAIIGVYGAVAYAVALRTREIGIRVALGGQSRDIVSLVVRYGMRLAAIGLVAGLAGALVLRRVIAGLLYEVTPTDPLAFAGAAALLLSVALAATYGPARRAMRIDPIAALRAD